MYIMSKIFRSFTDLIGNTPLLELSNYQKKLALKGDASGQGWNILIPRER